MKLSPMKEQMYNILRERHAERNALSKVIGVSFSDCLKLNGIETKITVQDKNGENIVIRGQDIYNEQAWRKFLLAHMEQEPCMFMDTADRLAHEFRTWILSDYTERYRLLSSLEELRWIEQVIEVVICRRIMLNKHKSQDFADDWASVEMSKIVHLGDALSEMTKGINHILKDKEHIDTFGEQATLLIENLYKTNLEHVQSLPSTVYEPLPPLLDVPMQLSSPLRVGA